MIQIFTNTPLWVWPLLALLVWLGMRARKTRAVPLAMIYALPALAVMPFQSTMGLAAGSWIWLVFVIAFISGAGAGFLVQARWVLGFEGRKVELAGENLTMVMLMLVFWANFAAGVLQVVAPRVVEAALFQGPFVAVIAASGGSFAGRAMRVMRLRQSSGATGV